MSYDHCPDAYADGVFNIPSVHPSYRPELDSDHDGLACEQPVPSGTNLATYKPSQTSTASPAQLPVTGSDHSPVGLVALALLLVVLGVVGLVWGSQSAYRRRH